MDLYALLNCSPSTAPDGSIHTEVDVDLLEAWVARALDPDVHVCHWLRHGTPLGIAEPLNDVGIFPAVEHSVDTGEYEAHTLSEQAGWANYAGVDLSQLVHAELTAMTDKRYLRCFASRRELVEFLGAEPVLSKLALYIYMQKEVRLPGGSSMTKSRLIMDCRRSGVNSLAVQSNRIMLHFPRDVVQDGLVLRATAAAAGKCTDLEAL
eukprot:5749824-Amphidinium_carterae.2